MPTAKPSSHRKPAKRSARTSTVADLAQAKRDIRSIQEGLEVIKGFVDLQLQARREMERASKRSPARKPRRSA